jgi:hypothetical protein
MMSELEITIKGNTVDALAVRSEIIALLDKLHITIDTDRGMTIDTKLKKNILVEAANGHLIVHIYIRGT